MNLPHVKAYKPPCTHYHVMVGEYGDPFWKFRSYGWYDSEEDSYEAMNEAIEEREKSGAPGVSSALLFRDGKVVDTAVIVP